MIWQILILTQPSRYEFLAQLLPEFERQIKSNVEVVVSTQRAGEDVGAARHRMKLESNAQFVSFFDDDDWPAPNFISRVMHDILGGIRAGTPKAWDFDYVGFKVKIWRNFVDFGVATHSLKCVRWSQDQTPDGKYICQRDISHLNPMRRELAIQAKMEGSFGEDHRWGDAMRSLGVAKSERFIDAELYHYLWRTPKNDAQDAKDTRRIELITNIRESVQTVVKQ